jgi:hypothetical protein
VRDEGCSAARILAARGADRERVRAAVLREMAAGGDRPDVPPDRRPRISNDTNHQDPFVGVELGGSVREPAR